MWGVAFVFWDVQGGSGGVRGRGEARVFFRLALLVGRTPSMTCSDLSSLAVVVERSQSCASCPCVVVPWAVLLCAHADSPCGGVRGCDAGLT